MCSQYQERNWTITKKSNAFWAAHIQFGKTSTGVGWVDEENCSCVMHATKAFI